MSYEYPSYRNSDRGDVIHRSDYEPMVTGEDREQSSAELLRAANVMGISLDKKLCQENERIKAENKRISRLLVKRDLEIDKLEEEIERLQSSQTGDQPPAFHYAINRRVWLGSNMKPASVTQIEKLSDHLVDLVNLKDQSGNYIVQQKKDIAPIYKILKESKKLPLVYTGDAPDFEFFWNDNIVPRMDDPGRRTQLTCVSKTLKQDKNADLWNGVDINSWSKMVDSGINSNEYQRGCVIKKIIESFVY